MVSKHKARTWDKKNETTTTCFLKHKMDNKKTKPHNNEFTTLFYQPNYT
jgi:hypothetical protein